MVDNKVVLRGTWDTPDAIRIEHDKLDNHVVLCDTWYTN